MKKIIPLILVLLLTTACASWQGASKKDKGTAVGAGVGAAAGAGLGQAIGRSTEATLLGAAIGAAVGGIAGNQIGAYMDRQERELRSVAEQSEAMSVERNRNVLTATFKSDIMFDFDSSVIKPGGYVELDRVARVLRQYPQTVIRVEGHTDKSGSEAYNQRLSETRAEAVKTALMQRGIISSRIQTIGFGENMPISSDPAVNRRVNIVIVPVEKRT